MRLLQTDQMIHYVFVFDKKTIVRYLDLTLFMSDEIWPGALPNLVGRIRSMAC